MRTGNMQRLEMIPHEILLKISLTVLFLSFQIISLRHDKKRLWDQLRPKNVKEKDMEDEMN